MTATPIRWLLDTPEPTFVHRHADRFAVRDRFAGTDTGVARTFPGLLGISPGIDDLTQSAGPDCWVAHSSGAARAIQLSGKSGQLPRMLLLIDPWPPNIEVPHGPELVVVVTGRPGRVTVSPGTRLVTSTPAAGRSRWKRQGSAHYA